MVRLPPLFSDHMVLQQGKYLPIWGEGSGKVCARLGAHQAYTLCEEGHWRLILPPIPAGGPYTLTVQDENSSVHITDVMIGEVWLAAGQSNMEQPTFAVEEGLTRAAEGANSRIRFFTVPRRTRPDFTGHRWHFGSVAAVDTGWSVCTEETMLHFSAIGAFFAQLLEQAEQIPVGIISCNFGGSGIEAWIPREHILTHPALQKAQEQYNTCLGTLDLKTYERQYAEFQKAMEAECRAWDAFAFLEEYGPSAFARKEPIRWPAEPFPAPYWPSWPGVLYRNMVQRVIPYSIRGILWYQGENNVVDSENYDSLFALLVSAWRRAWGDELPFLTVQLAPFGYGSLEDYPQMVERQIAASRQIPGVAMITTSDLGECDNIHPLKKQPMAQRLFLAAEKLVYHKSVEYSGPIYREVHRNGSKVELRFDHADSGLVCREEVSELYIADENGQLVPAKAELSGSTMLVWAESVSCPMEVRMGFCNNCTINLYNGDGLVAAPFRTGRLTE